MSLFDLKVDSRSEEYLTSIKYEMINLFNIPEAEAVGRINSYWRRAVLLGDQIMLYHEDETYWANTIYYGKDSRWWLREGEVIEPLPFPF